MNISRPHRLNPLIMIVVIIAIVLAAGVMWWLLKSQTAAPKKAPDPQISSETQTVVSSQPSFDKKLYSTIDPTSLWVIVNKQHPLTPIDFTPADIITGLDGYAYSQRIDTNLRALFKKAETDGIAISLTSAFRPFSGQQTLYRNYTAQYGQATADTISARAGYSEHQTGLTVDISGSSQPACNFNPCFVDTAEGKWLTLNAREFGFIVRYTAGNEDITGYNPEAWHLRYVGAELASILAKEKIDTLEEFFNVKGGKVYK